MEEIAIQEIKSIVQASTLLSASEKQEWLDLCEVMNDEQLIELKTILLSVIPAVKVSTPAPALKPNIESKLPPLKHILNLPKSEEARPVASNQPVEKLNQPSKFWQKVKNLLAEKELPPGHQEPTKELELPEHANLPPTSLIKTPSKLPELKTFPKPVAKPPLTPKPPVKPPTVNQDLSTTVKTAVKEALVEIQKSEHPPVQKSKISLPVQLKDQPSQHPNVPIKLKQSVQVPQSIKSVEPKVENQESSKLTALAPNLSQSKKVQPVPVEVPVSNPTILKIPKLESLKVDKIVVNEDAYNEKSSYKVLNPEEIKKTILQNTPTDLSEVKDKIVAEPKLESNLEEVIESVEVNSKEVESNFVPGLANPNILAEVKLTQPEKMAKVKPIASSLPIAPDFNNLDQVSTLTKEALSKDLVPALKHLIVKSGFFDVYSALEKSSLFASYINTGLNVLAGKADFNSNQKPALNKEQFERFVDVLRGIKH